MFFSMAKDNGKLVLVIDVESCIVNGSLIHMKSGDMPTVVFSCSATISWKPHTDSTYLVKTTEKAIKETINTALRHAHSRRVVDNLPKKISTVHYTLSSPWIISRAKFISTTFEKETLVTKEYIMDLIGNERTKLTSAQTESVKVIEEKIFDIRLNGYSVAEWENKSTKKLDVSFTVSVAGTRSIERFVMLCDHVVPTHEVHFHSSLLLKYMGAEKTLDTTGDYMLIHIHGELTDIVMVKDRSCIFFGSYPFGARTLIRKISSSTKLDMQAADSLIALYTGDRLDQSQNKNSYSVIDNISEGWAKELEKVVKLSGHKIQPPESIVLAVCTHEDFFAKVINKFYPNIRINMLQEIELLPAVIHSME